MFCFVDCSNADAAQIQVASAFGSVDTTPLVDGDIMLGLLIWLVILTCLLLGLCVWICKQFGSLRQERQCYVNSMQDIFERLQGNQTPSE